jgi:serine/threonine protein kinase
MAPEMVNRKDYGKEVDVWALGVLIFKVCAGEYPFRGITDKKLFKQINECKPDYPFYFSDELINLLIKIFR